MGKSITQKISDEYVKKYGFDNWYDWAVENWGVKWAPNSENVVSEIGENWAKFEFDTPWNPPEPIVGKLRDLFPELTISWFYKEPGMQLAGWL